MPENSVCKEEFFSTKFLTDCWWYVRKLMVLYNLWYFWPLNACNPWLGLQTLRHSPLVDITQSHILNNTYMQICSLYPILYPELLKLHIHLVHGFCIYMSYNHFKLNIFITKFLLPLPSQSVSHPGFPTTIQPEAEAQNSVVIFDFSFSHSSFAIFGKSHWIF